MKRETVVIEQKMVKKLCGNLLWALKAKSNDSSRYVMNNIFVDGDDIVCTDGRRLHIWKGGRLISPLKEEGMYQVIKGGNYFIFNPVDDGDFPNYKKIIPAKKDRQHKYDIVLNSGSASAAVGFLSHFYYKGKKSLNYQFMKDLEGFSWIVSSSENDVGLCFENDDLLAIVMPLLITF